MDNSKRRLASAKDIVIVAVILFAAVTAMIIMKFLPQSQYDKQAVILLDGTEVYRTNISGIKYSTFTVTQIEGMEFEISGGKIRVSDSDCHDKICESTGFISRNSEAIVCLPNRVVVKIEDKNTDSINNIDVVV